MNLIDKQLLRKTAGLFATGITVVALKDQNDQIQAMTANSFLSVSLDPPLILFSVDINRKFLNYLKVNNSIGLSILSDKQTHLSRIFANQENIFTHDLWDKSQTVPILNNSLAWYQLNIDKCIVVGDHELIICEVIALGSSNQNPILFFQGQYKNLQ